MNIEQILEKVTVVPLYVAAVVLPSFFLPITSELLEWNKHYLLGILVVISLLAWLARGLVTKKLTITRSPLDWPFLAWWAVVLVSSILAKDRIVAFFGPATDVSWSFIALTFYLLFAFLLFWTIRSEERLTRILDLFGIGIGISALYFWLGRLGLLGWLPGPESNPVALLTTHFGVLHVFLLVLALGMLMMPRLRKHRQIIWGILAGLSFITIVAIGFSKIWLAAAIGLFLLLLLSFPRLGQVRYPVVSLTMVAFVLALVFLILGTPQFLRVETNPEVSLSHARSFQIAGDTLKEGVVPFLFGSGSGTFVYDFSAHRPESFNLSTLWNVRFAKPVAVSYKFLAELGVVGSLSVVVVVLVGLGTVYQLWGRRKLAAGAARTLGSAAPIAAAWMTTVAMLFFVMYGTALWLFFFLSLVLLVIAGQLVGVVPAKEAQLSMKTTPQYALASSFLYIVVVALVVVGGIFLGRFYGADVVAIRAARAAAAGEFSQAEQGFLRATQLDPYRSRYALGLARTFLRDAAAETRSANADRARVGALVGNAINASRRATDLAPQSVESWEQLARMYANARVLAAEANQWVITSLERAIALEPTNPRLYVDRGIAYRLMPEREADALAEFERAVQLKPNYALAHYQLSILQEGMENFDEAVRSAALAVQHAPRAIDAKFNLARLLYNRNQENDWEGAERLYRNILTQNPDHANTLYALGVLFERQGDAAGAAALYEQVLELDPNAAVVQARLDQLPEGTPRRVAPEPVAEADIEEESGESESE